MAMVRLLDNLCNSLLDPNKRDMKLNMKEYSFNGANFTQSFTVSSSLHTKTRCLKTMIIL